MWSLNMLNNADRSLANTDLVNCRVTILCTGRLLIHSRNIFIVIFLVDFSQQQKTPPEKEYFHKWKNALHRSKWAPVWEWRTFWFKKSVLHWKMDFNLCTHNMSPLARHDVTAVGLSVWCVKILHACIVLWRKKNFIFKRKKNRGRTFIFYLFSKTFKSIFHHLHNSFKKRSKN